MMQYRRLGRSGLVVSRACLGTMTFGREADEEMSFRLMDAYWEAGGNVLDTADAYSTGVSEQIVGRWIKDRGVRDRVVLATKVYGTMGPGPNDGGLSRIHIQQAVEASLRRLQTDVIDLYQIHRWDFGSEPEETLGALDDLVRQGKVRYVACSNLKGWHLQRFLALADLRGWSRFVSIQPIYNAINRSIEAEVLEVEAMETSDLVERPIKKIKWPKDAIIAGVIRGGEGKVIAPKGDTVIDPGDRVIIFAKRGTMPKVEKVLSVKLNYF